MYLFCVKFVNPANKLSSLLQVMSTDVTETSNALSVCDAPSVGYSDAMCDVIATRVADLERECPITPQKSQQDQPCVCVCVCVRRGLVARREYVFQCVALYMR